MDTRGDNGGNVSRVVEVLPQKKVIFLSLPRNRWTRDDIVGLLSKNDQNKTSEDEKKKKRKQNFCYINI